MVVVVVVVLPAHLQLVCVFRGLSCFLSWNCRYFCVCVCVYVVECNMCILELRLTVLIHFCCHCSASSTVDLYCNVQRVASIQ